MGVVFSILMTCVCGVWKSRNVIKQHCHEQSVSRFLISCLASSLVQTKINLYKNEATFLF